MLICDTPPLQNQYFCGPMEVKMEVKWGLKSIFIAIENDDGNTMLYREEASLRMKFWAQAEEGFREELASDTEQDLRWRGRRIWQYVICLGPEWPRQSQFFWPRQTLGLGTLNFGPRRLQRPLGSYWSLLGAIGSLPEALPMEMHRETYGNQAKNHA